MKTLIISTLFFFFYCSIIIGQSFSVSYTSPQTIQHPNVEKSVRFTFTYYNMNGLVAPHLTTSVDGGNSFPTPSGGSSYTPSYIDLDLDEGVHTIIFTLISLSANPPPDWIVHQQSIKYVTLKFEIKIYNVFTTGNIYVDNYVTPKTSPYERVSQTNDEFDLGAIDQDNGGYNRIWNETGSNLSNWEKKQLGGNWNEINSMRNFEYQVAAGDVSADIRANLRKNFKITQNEDFSEFDNLITNTETTYIVEQNSGQIDAPASKTINGKNYLFAGWTDGNGDNPRTISPTDNTTYTALYKYPQHSNNPTAYSNSSQRKFVRTDNGYLHMVYESMGKAWYEISTDAGLTWQIANNGLPLSGTKDSKLPAIDYSGDVVVIVWQQEDIGAYDIIMAKFTAGNYMYGATIFMDIYLPYSSNTNPVVSWDGEGRILVMWKRDEDNYGYWPTGIVFSYGALSMLGWNEMDFDVIPTTNSNSINPTLVADKDYNLIPAEYHLAWEEPAGFYTYVKYFELYRDGYNEIQSRFPATPSNGAGFWTNRKPSITVLDDHTPRLVWVGYTPWYLHRTVFRAKQTNGLWSSTIYNYSGVSSESVNINRTDENDYAFGWSQLYGYPNKYVKSSNLWQIRDFGTTGKDIQVCNAANFYSMYSLAFQSDVPLPYRFVKSSSIGNLNKTTQKTESIGRAAIVTKDSTEFIYALGDVLLNDEPIKFKDVKNTLQINSQQELNNYLKSKPFYLDNRSALSFSVVSGVVNPRVAPMLLEEGKYIKFKVELIEDKTGEILNSFAILEYNANNVEELTNLSFSLKTSGMIKTKVHLKILLDENISGEYTLSELIGVDSVLHIGKEGYQEVSFGGDLAVIEYALEQNYPNPFNPSTTLKYQIPQNGFVTLKVYDILGKEVASLVNEVKTQGRYEVNFNASDLASGVYLYRLNVNDYIDVKKMILLK